MFLVEYFTAISDAWRTSIPGYQEFLPRNVFTLWYQRDYKKLLDNYVS